MFAALGLSGLAGGGGVTGSQVDRQSLVGGGRVGGGGHWLGLDYRGFIGIKD